MTQQALLNVIQAEELHNLISVVYRRGYEEALDDADVPADFYREERAEGCAQVQADTKERQAAILSATADLTSQLAEVREALEQIAALKWPDIKGYHEYSTWGEATGNEYRHKFPIYEEPNVTLKRAKAIAADAIRSLTSKEEHHG